MHPDDTEEFTKLMAMLGEVFGKEVTKPLAKIYFRTFHDLTIQEFSAAVWEWIAHGSFFPKPVELSDLALTFRKIQRDISRPMLPEDTAEQEWKDRYDAWIKGVLNAIPDTPDTHE
jgi:hypothetical protein